MTIDRPWTKEERDEHSRTNALAQAKAKRPDRQRSAHNMNAMLQLSRTMAANARSTALARWGMTIITVTRDGVTALLVLLKLDTAGTYVDRDQRLNEWAASAPLEELHSLTDLALCVDDVMHSGADVARHFLTLCKQHGVEVGQGR